LLQMRGGGWPPRLPDSPGLGVTIDPEIIAKHRVSHWQSETPST
jgi:L-alanine-DL-glutamate epimerase-like enolase superfamily enzyme